MEEKYNEFKRQYCKANDVNRCQANNKKGEQCCYRAIEGEQFCPGHIKGLRKKKMAIYNAEKWRANIDRHVQHSQIFSLREELGVLRILLEKQLNRCGDDELELEQRAPAITDLVNKVQITVLQGVKLEQKLAQLLDVGQVNNFAEAVIHAVTTGVGKLSVSQEEKDELLDAIANSIEQAMPSPQ